MIKFNDVSYVYPEDDYQVFNNVSIEIPKGITSLVGQNGTGKTTFLLLSAGLLIPTSGEVFLLDTDTRNIKSSSERQKLASFIYQNMEFETEESIHSLLHVVYNSGFHTNQNDDFIRELVELLELSSVLNKRTQEISKGELQRVIIGFSLLYGSKTLIMDEPIFALEEYQKKKIMNYLKNYSIENNISIVYSAHELDITGQYSDYICYFYKDKHQEIGRTSDLFTEEKLEKVFNIPFAMLKHKEYIFREALLESKMYN